MDVIKKINTIEQFENIKKTLKNKNYLFRGEPREFEKISSGLYRYAIFPTTLYVKPVNVDMPITLQLSISHEELKKIESEIQHTQEEIRKEIINYIQTNNLTKTTSFSMEYIQHYEGVTNFIDFTSNFDIATYFCCSKDQDIDGRIILIQNTDNYKRIDLYKDSRFTENKRVQKQESVLIETKEGNIEIDGCEIILIISKNIKKDILERLYTDNVNEESIYPDEGDIEVKQCIEQLNEELYDLPAHLKNARELHFKGLNGKNIEKEYSIKMLKESIEEYDKAIKINIDNHTPHTLKAEVLLKIYELTGEISYLKSSLESCDISIKLNPDGKEPLLHSPRFKNPIVTINKKGIAYRIKGIIYDICNIQYLALVNLNKAIEINPKENLAFYRRGVIYYRQYENSVTKEMKIQKLDMAIKDFQKQIDVTTKQSKNIVYTKCLELKDKAIRAKNNLNVC